VIQKYDLSTLQYYLLAHYKETAMAAWNVDHVDHWNINMSAFEIHGYTLMDNNDMMDFMNQIGISQQKVKWETEGW
jgi:hypothetical protein